MRPRPPVTVAETLAHLRIVDDVTLARGTAEAFLAHFDGAYRSAAEARGYRLESCMVSPPLDVDGEPTHVVLTWSLDDLRAARAAGPRWDLRLLRDAPPEAVSFWQDQGDSVINRSRRIMRVLTPPWQAALAAPAAGTTAGVAPYDPSGATAVRCVVFVHVADGASPPPASAFESAVTNALGSAPLYSHASAHVAPTPAGGDLTWDLVVPVDVRPGLGAVIDAVGARLGATVAHLDAVTLDPLCGVVPEPGLTDLVKRTLLFRVRDDADPQLVADLETALVGMVDHIPAIRNWSLSRVTPVTASSDLPRWTHAWEQEYIDLDGLQHDYLEALYHWAHVDTFYDEDHPRGIVEWPVGHVFCPATTSVLAPAMGAIGMA